MNCTEHQLQYNNYIDISAVTAPPYTRHIHPLYRAGSQELVVLGWVRFVLWL
jgi:hypothetical protein